MSDSEQGGFIARAAALRVASPRAEDVIPLPDVVTYIGTALDLTACEAGRLLVHELMTGTAADVALFRAFYGRRIEPISAHGATAEPGDFNDSRTHWPSERHNELSRLPMALLMGHALGDPSHPDSSGAADLVMLRADFTRCFVVPLRAHLQATTTASLSPALSPPLPLVTAGGVVTREDKIATALAEVQQPERNDKGQVNWRSLVTASRFMSAYEALRGANCKAGDALQLIAERWGCGQGSSLRKKVTYCDRLVAAASTKERRSTG